VNIAAAPDVAKQILWSGMMTSEDKLAKLETENVELLNECSAYAENQECLENQLANLDREYKKLLRASNCVIIHHDENVDENSFGALVAAKVRETDEDKTKEEIWNRFMENMKHVVKLGEEPIHVLNFLGSVKKHKVEFMKIDISDLTK